MPSNHIGRVNEEILRELSELLRDLKDPRIRGLVSITRVDTTGDLRYAKVYISVLDKDGARDVMRGLSSAAGWLRREMGARLSLRYTPELLFERDDSINRGAHILSLLHGLAEGESSAKEAEASAKERDENDG